MPPATQIDKDATTILGVLADASRDDYVDRNVIAEKAGLPPDRVNDAMALLVDAGHAEWILGRSGRLPSISPTRWSRPVADMNGNACKPHSKGFAQLPLNRQRQRHRHSLRREP